MSDLLGNTRFVLITTVSQLPVAEAIRDVLRKNDVAALIINDEKAQALPDDERTNAKPIGPSFRIEVPETVAKQAKEIYEIFVEQLKGQEDG